MIIYFCIHMTILIILNFMICYTPYLPCLNLIVQLFLILLTTFALIKVNRKIVMVKAVMGAKGATGAVMVKAVMGAMGAKAVMGVKEMIMKVGKMRMVVMVLVLIGAVMGRAWGRAVGTVGRRRAVVTGRRRAVVTGRRVAVMGRRRATVMGETVAIRIIHL
jgi:hypothetical protein